MNNWSAPQRPNSYAEQSLITAILNGTFPPGTSLPGERTLAAELGVTRPTLREALQRLARDGWLTVRQGKATAVNDFWQDGGLNVLSAIVRHSEQLPIDFITNLLQVRLQLAPAYIQAAVARAPEICATILAQHETLADTAEALAAFDWQLHRQLAIASGNPIYTMILNGFAGVYEQLAQHYFLPQSHRQQSRLFYAALATAVANHDAPAAATISRTAMQESIKLWQAVDLLPTVEEADHASLERLG